MPLSAMSIYVLDTLQGLGFHHHPGQPVQLHDQYIQVWKQTESVNTQCESIAKGLEPTHNGIQGPVASEGDSQQGEIRSASIQASKQLHTF